MLFTTEQSAILTEASDVTMPEARLDELAHLAEDIYKSDGPDRHVAFGYRLSTAVASNPNISPSTMGYLATHAPVEILDNPVLPLYIFSGDVLSWEWEQISWLRKCAFEQGHSHWPSLMTFCAPQWRTRLRVHRGPACWALSCFTCYPERKETYLQQWSMTRGDE